MDGWMDGKETALWREVIWSGSGLGGGRASYNPVLATGQEATGHFPLGLT
jgi:hypothetical protein